MQLSKNSIVCIAVATVMTSEMLKSSVIRYLAKVNLTKAMIELNNGNLEVAQRIVFATDTGVRRQLEIEGVSAAQIEELMRSEPCKATVVEILKEMNADIPAILVELKTYYQHITGEKFQSAETEFQFNVPDVGQA